MLERYRNVDERLRLYDIDGNYEQCTKRTISIEARREDVYYSVSQQPLPHVTRKLHWAEAGNTYLCIDKRRRTHVTIPVDLLLPLPPQGHTLSGKASRPPLCIPWDEQEVLKRNPTSGIEIKAQQTLAPRILSPDQRFVLRNLVEKADDVRGKALFALGYWAGCRVSDVAYLLMEHTHVGPKIGWLHVGHKGEKFRDIDLLNEARRPLYDYIQHGGRDAESIYVFTSQRSPHLTEDGIHHWFRTFKQRANREEWELISDLSFHDLRHDFAHRAREAGWTLEEVAYYLGHVTMKSTPAIQTTLRYTQVSRTQVKEKLKLLRG